MAFERSAARWDARGPDAYTFVFDQVCECLPPRTVHLTVEGGDVVAALALPLTTPPVELDPANYRTIDELFERLRRDAAAGPVVFEVTFDAELGYPRTAEVNVRAEIADDEYRFEVSEVSRMERLE